MVRILLLVAMICGISAIAEEKTELDLLLSAAKDFVETAAEKYPAFKKKTQEKIDQRANDSQLSNDAALISFFTDYIADNQKFFKAKPENVPQFKIIELAMHLRFVTEDGTRKWDGWETYKSEIHAWRVFLESRKVDRNGIVCGK